MRRPLLFLVLVTAVLADDKAHLSNVLVIQNLNLKTEVATDITCSSIKKIVIEDVTVSNYTCTGDTLSKANEPGMYIITQMQPIAFPNNKLLTWFIECSSGNLTSSFTLEDVLDKLLTATSIAQHSETKEKAFSADDDNLRQQQPFLEPAEAAANATTTTEPQTTKKPADPTTKAAATTVKPPTPINVTVTVGYIQFQTGQAPTYVNKNTQAVVFAVIEGLLLGAILVVFVVRCYRKSKLRAAGMYPARDISHPVPNRNTVYYDNGGTLSGPASNPRLGIPSYRTQDTQPPLRLDSLSPRQQQPVITPNLVPVTTTQPRPISTASTVTPAPLNNWPDQPGQPIKNIMDSDI